MAVPDAAAPVVCALALLILIAAFLWSHRGKRPDPKWQLYSSLFAGADPNGDEKPNRCPLN